MLKYIRPLIPEHILYCEPYAGSAAVFFDKEPAQVEVINDLNGELVNFYHTAVNNFEELKREVYATLHSRDTHKHAMYIYNNPQFFSNVKRAWAVWSLSKQGFSGILSGSFSYSKKKNIKPTKINNAKLAFNNTLKERLESTTIESDAAISIIKRYDDTYSFFFVDPPYVGCNMGHYNNMFNEQDLKELLDVLAGLKGKFMLTMYPNDTIKQYADNNGWNITPVIRQVTACMSKHQRKQEEWIIYNYSV